MAAKFAFNNTFKAEVNGYCEQLQRFGFLQKDGHELFCYGEPPDFVLRNQKFSRHMRFLSDPNDVSARGGGYWFFKALLLQHHMDQSNDGDVVIWTDVDRIDFVQHNKSFHTILKALEERGDDMCIETMPISWAREVWWTKEDILAAFNASDVAKTNESESLRASSQQNANALVLRMSPRMKMFIDAWVECNSDWHMISDEQSILPNSQVFIFNENRHDQSILSMLIKRFMTRQDVIGPPARPFYADGSGYHTYKLLDSVDPSCPFAAFYELHERQNSSKKNA